MVNRVTGDDPTRLVRDRCEPVRQYRITASGNVLAEHDGIENFTIGQIAWARLLERLGKSLHKGNCG